MAIYHTYDGSEVYIKDKSISVFGVNDYTFEILNYDKVWIGGEQLEAWEAKYEPSYQKGLVMLTKKVIPSHNKELFAYTFIGLGISSFKLEDEIIGFGSPIINNRIYPYAVSDTKTYNLTNLGFTLNRERPNDYDFLKDNRLPTYIPYRRF
jgi:hypothetical protein